MKRGETAEGKWMRRGRGFAGLTGGGVAWLLHLLLSYLVAEFGCLRGWGNVRFLEITAVSWLLFLVSLGTLALAGLACWASWRAAVVAEENGLAGRSRDFMARAGLIANGFFLFAILVESVPILCFLRAC